MKSNINLVKTNSSYTFLEISQLLNVHVRSIQNWRKKGLKIIDENSRPYIVLGIELKRFLKEKTAGRKYTLSAGEFYCFKCRLPRESKPNQIQYIHTNKLLGKSEKQVTIKGICQKCNSPVFRFSTEEKIKIIITNGLLSTKRDIILLAHIEEAQIVD